jgi:CubicO group peptidase (beta-lactamase class C family)
MAAVAVMQLVERGKVGLDDPIRKYVPRFPDKGAYSAERDRWFRDRDQWFR